MLKSAFCIAFVVASAAGMAIEVKNIHPDDLKAALDDPKVEVGVFDYRSAFARETEGQIKSSYPVPEKQINALATLELNKDIVAVVVADDPKLGSEATNFLLELNFTNVQTYLDGIAKWKEDGGMIDYPKSVSFEALSQLLKEDSIVLVDVRNRTEFNKVGKIPGSYILPLHEVEAAMDLKAEEFKEKYGFDKPDPEALNVVLTCGSGVRASLADGILQRFGYSHLRIYYGSFDDWKANNGTVEEVKLDVDYEN